MKAPCQSFQRCGYETSAIADHSRPANSLMNSRSTKPCPVGVMRAARTAQARHARQGRTARAARCVWCCCARRAAPGCGRHSAYRRFLVFQSHFVPFGLVDGFFRRVIQAAHTGTSASAHRHEAAHKPRDHREKSSLRRDTSFILTATSRHQAIQRLRGTTYFHCFAWSFIVM